MKEYSDNPIYDEAIDRNQELKGELLREGHLEKAEAVQMGIEALKREKKWRESGLIFTKPVFYPGETIGKEDSQCHEFTFTSP